MAFGTQTVAQRDVQFNVNLGQFRAQLGEADALYRRVTGGMSDSALRLNIKQYELNRAVEKFGVDSVQAAKRATALTAEMTSLTAASERHTGALLGEERALGRFSRGALAAGGASSELKRALLLGSGSFLLGVGLLSGLKKALDAAKEQQVAQAQLRVALNNSGLAWTQYGERAQKAIDVQVGTSAFKGPDITAALAANVRRFKDFGEAVRATTIAEDVARGRTISLSDAQTLLQRASFGNTKALKTLGIEMTASTANVDRLRETTKHATREQLAQAKAADLQANQAKAFNLAASTYAGNAARYLTTAAGKQEKLNAELNRSEEIIGRALLPTLDHYTTKLADWLDKMNRSGKLQRDVNAATRDAGIVFHTLGEILGPLVTDFRGLGKAVGGTKHEIELLTGAVTLLWLRARVARWGVVSGGVAGIGAAATTSATEVGMLRSRLLGLNALTIAPIAIPIVLEGVDKLDRFLGQHTSVAGDTPLPKGVSFSQAAAALSAAKAGNATAAQKALVDRLAAMQGKSLPFLSGSGPAHTDASSSGGGAAPATVGTGAGSSTRGYTPSGVQALDLAIAQAQASGSTSAIRAAAAAKLAYDLKAGAFAKGRIDAGKGSPSLVQQYEQVLGDEASQRSTIQGIDQAAASASKQKSDAAKALAAKAAKAPFQPHLFAELLKAARGVKQDANRQAASVADALTHRESVLKLAVDKAKLTDPVADDLKALEALEAFYRKQANDPRLSRKLRDTFAAKDVAERILVKKLKQTSQIGGDARANEQQFLSEFSAIVQNYAPNAFPKGTGKLETHGYETVHELRQQTQILKRLEANHKFPASGFAHKAVAAIG